MGCSVFTKINIGRGRNLYLLLVVFLCAASPATGQKPRDAASTHLKQGQRLSSQGDLTRAISSYNEAIKLRPTWAEAYLQRGYAQRMKGALDEAINDFDKATALDARTTRNNRNVAETYTNRGQIRRNRLEVDNALSDFDKAINIYDGESQFYFNRGQARLLNEDFAGAIADFDTSLKNPNGPFGRALALADRSLAKRLLGRQEDAQKDFDEMLKLVKDEKQGVLMHVQLLELQLEVIKRLRGKQNRLVALVSNSAMRRRQQPTARL